MTIATNDIGKKIIQMVSVNFFLRAPIYDQKFFS